MPTTTRIYNFSAGPAVLPLPAPPNVPADGLYVAHDPSGLAAVSALRVDAEVPGIDEGTFLKLAEDAKDGCPVSGALKGNVDISVQATLKN